MKKALSEEIEVVKQLDAERKAFKEIPMGRRAASPPIHAKSSFVFQPLDEYPTSSAPPMDDPDVWRPPSRDSSSRRPARAGQVGMRKSPQDGAWARGSTRPNTTTRGAKAGGSSRTNSGVRASTTGKKGSSTTGKSSKSDSAVSSVSPNFILSSFFLHEELGSYACVKRFFCCVRLVTFEFIACVFRSVWVFSKELL